MDVALCIFLHSVVLGIVADHLSARQDGHFELIFIVVVKVAVFVPDYSKAEIVVFVELACLRVYAQGEVIRRVICLPLTLGVLSHALTQLVIEEGLASYFYHLPAILLVVA